MSRRHRIKGRETAAAPDSSHVARPTSPPAAAAAAYSWDGSWAHNGHAAAAWSRERGQIYFPQLDTRREISAMTRTEILRKARWFTANLGLARRIVYGLARLAAGTGLTPHAMTADPEFNKAAEAYFASRAESPYSFDVGGRFDFYSAQPFALAAHYRDGDQATVMTESATRQAMFAFYEGHQLGSGTGTETEGWFDGVRVDAQNRARAYRFLGDDAAQADIPATDVMLLAEYERAGQSRSTSIFEHAVPHLHDATDIIRFIKSGVKLTNLQGYWVERDKDVAPNPNPYGGAVGPVTTQTVDAAGNKITLEQVIGGGAIPQLRPGETLKFNNAAHPHPNQLGLIDYLIRDVAWGCGVAPDLLWNIAALGGANTRFVLADAQSWIEKEQEKLIRQFCQRTWVYTIAKGLKTGALAPCQDPMWWKVGWIPPPRLTVDFGRDGKLYIEQNRSAMLSLKTIYGWQGQDWRPQVDQILDEVAYIKGGLTSRGMDWTDWQQYRNSQAAPDSASANASGFGPNDPAQASAFLAELAKNPTRAAAWMDHLRTQPIAA